MAAFKKGQLVTTVGSWDGKGTVFYRHAIVYSCGKKQMVLTDERTGEELGALWYNPRVGDLNEARTSFNWHAVFPRMSDEEAEDLCLKAGALIVAQKREHYMGCIERNKDNKGYVAGIERSIAGLHEPRVIKLY